MSAEFYKIRARINRQRKASDQGKRDRWAPSLSEQFGYAPDEADGERWVIFEGHSLIVIHPDRPPRLYQKGCKGRYIEIVPNDDGRIHVRRT